MTEKSLIFGLMASFNKTEYSITDLQYLTNPFEVSETSLRTNLSRLQKAGVLSSSREGKTALYRFSGKGKKISGNVSFSFSSPDWGGWDETWYTYSFTVPQIGKTDRYRIRTKLRAYRFASLYPGLYIRPYQEREKIETVFQDQLLLRHGDLLKSKFIHPLDTERAGSIWQLELINRGFENALCNLEDLRKELSGGPESGQNLLPAKALIGKMKGGSILIEAIAADPLLPDRFLPDHWSGDRIRRVFKDWDREMTEISKPYWKKITSGQKSGGNNENTG
jgi:DNA-binding transcriptional regulator PaaX